MWKQWDRWPACDYLHTICFSLKKQTHKKTLMIFLSIYLILVEQVLSGIMLVIPHMVIAFTHSWLTVADCFSSFPSLMTKNVCSAQLNRPGLPPDPGALKDAHLSLGSRSWRCTEAAEEDTFPTSFCWKPAFCVLSQAPNLFCFLHPRNEVSHLGKWPGPPSDDVWGSGRWR